MNEWYHLAMSRNDSVHRFYINGILVGYELVNAAAGFDTTGNKLWIGVRLGTGSYFNGAVDDIHICNRALDEAQIKAWYQPYSHGPVLPGPVCLDYKFQNNTLDSGGQGYNLTNHGGTFTQDRFGNPNSAIQFNGVNQYLELSNADSLATTGELSIGVWVKPYHLPGSGQQGDIVNLGDGTYDHGFNLANGYLGVYNGFTTWSYTTPNSNAKAYDSAVLVPVNMNGWYHLAMSRNDSVHRFYINGQLVGFELTNAPAGFDQSGNKLWVGARLGAGSFFNGAVDDLHFCNRALDESQILAWYQALTSVQIPNSPGEMPWRIYPNPSHGTFAIEIKDEPTEICVMDMLGKEVYKQTYQSNTVSTHLSPGTYFVELKKAGQSLGTQRVVIY